MRNVNLIFEKEKYEPEMAQKLAESYFLKGQCLAEMENYNEALYCFQHVVELQPDNAEVNFDSLLVFFFH